MTTSIRTQIATFSLEPSGTMVIRHDQPCRIDEATMREMMTAHLQLSGGHKRPTLIDIRGVRAMSREARSIAGKGDVAREISRLALLVSNPVTRVIATLFVSVTGPAYPTKVFSNEDSARAWLGSGA